MMNFWISLYVTIVIVISGSVLNGSDGERGQISRIGSHDQKILTQGRRTDGPKSNSQQTLPTPPDEQ